jgi:HEAT repeat protein
LALKKSDSYQEVNELYKCDSLSECIDKLSIVDTLEDRHALYDSLLHVKDGPKHLVAILKDAKVDIVDLGYIIAILSSLDKRKAPIDDILDLLSVENAYIRNGAITILRDYGDEIIYFIVKSLLSPDRDIRILALNVLGDVTFKESRDLMVDLLEQEQDLNVAMTAVDYLSEIGTLEDIDLLDSLKSRFNNDTYVQFAVDRAIQCIKDDN